MASERRLRAQDAETLEASARRRRADRHRRCRFPVAGAEAAQRPLTEAGVLAHRSGLGGGERPGKRTVSAPADSGSATDDLDQRRLAWAFPPHDEPASA